MKFISMQCKYSFATFFIISLYVIIGTVIGCETIGPNVIKRIIKNGIINVEAKDNSVILTIIKKDGQFIRNTLYTKSVSNMLPSRVYNCGVNNICVISGSIDHTLIETNPMNEVIKITRQLNDKNGQLIDCYQLKDDTQWYGGPQLRYQHWPIQHMYYEEEPYVPTHPTNMAVTERYWLSSKGIYIYVKETDPLFLDQNNYKDKHLCLIAKNKIPYRNRETITLHYEIGVFDNPKLAHQDAVRQHLGKPNGYPDERMIQHPIWSTWARYKANINENLVNAFADEITTNGYSNSQLEIDDNWETCYGSAEFDTTKFPNITALSTHLKQKGFRVTLWIHPFINENCNPAYTYALTNNYFVKNTDGEVHTTWWQGETGAGVIDFTNPDAVTWWVNRLKNLVELGIDSFKFDAGEISWLPQIANINGPLEEQPAIFTKAYVTALATNFDDKIEARVGWRSQQLPIFIRMIDKDSTWTRNNGLPTLITTLLQMNLNGYVHVLPDMIGGNGYADNPFTSSVLPSKELFIRWLEANVFMPSLQYSFVPWDYDDEANAICKKYTDLHADLTPRIVRLMKNSIQTGAPLNPPIWWVDPNNAVAHKVNDEYLLGEEILVAPVIQEGATSRDIYLPTGKWRDGNNNTFYVGPIWLRDYPTPLHLLPYFFKTE